MLKKEINRLEVSLDSPYMQRIIALGKGQYILKLIHQDEAVFRRPRSLFFAFTIEGKSPQEVKEMLGLRDISAQYGAFAYIGAGDEVSGYFMKEIILSLPQDIPTLEIALRTFLPNHNILVEAFQIFNAEIPREEIYGENTSRPFFRAEEIINFLPKDEETISFIENPIISKGLSLKEIDKVSLKSFEVNRDMPKSIILNDIDEGTYLLSIKHQEKSVFENEKSLFFTFSIPEVESTEEVKGILGLSSVSNQHGVFSYTGGGTYKDGEYYQKVLLKISKPLNNLNLLLKSTGEKSTTIDNLTFLSKSEEVQNNSPIGVNDSNSDYKKHIGNYSIEKDKESAVLSLKKSILKTIPLKAAQCYHLMNIEVCSDKAFLDISLEFSSELEGKYKLLVLFECFDRNNKEISKVPGMGVSSAFGKPFKYLIDQKSIDKNVSIKAIKTMLPPEVSRCDVYLAAVGLKNDQLVNISLKGKFISHLEEEKKDDVKLLGNSLGHQPKVKKIKRNNTQRFIKELNIACILDEFTTECLRHEVSLIPITQENWEKEIASRKIDFLLVESCWRGNNGNWGTLTRGSGGGSKLSGILTYCKKHGIPTVFWNKEDPPHYDKFGAVARLFDQVITTDINMLPLYKKDFGIDAFPLSFAAQPKIHKPSSSIKRLNKAVFAGSYYGDKPKRCSDFNLLMTKIEDADIDYDIFDRNYERNIEKFEFPIDYQKNIKGCLPADEVWKAHLGYKYQINMNTVQDSQTMFARRVYESLASGTPVISNYSLGVKEKFGDIVLFSEDDDLVSKLITLEHEPKKYLSLAKEGVRRVMREHTYAHRIQEICRLLGIYVSIEKPRAAMVVNVSNETEIEQALNLYREQTASNKHLFIEMDNFDNAYQFLNQSSDNISYSMRFARNLYTDLSKLYGTEIVLPIDLNQTIENEALEDFIYWGEL